MFEIYHKKSGVSVDTSQMTSQTVEVENVVTSTLFAHVLAYVKRKLEEHKARWKEQSQNRIALQDLCGAQRRQE